MLIGLYYLRIKLKFNVLNYLNNVLIPILKSLLVIIPIPFLISMNMDSWMHFIFSSFSIVTISLITYNNILLTKGESLIVKTYLNKIFKTNNV